MNVIVIGGSLGGLMHGIVLKRLGHTVRILERNPSPLLHNQGAGVVAGNDTQDFFQHHDLTHRPLAVTSHLRHYLDVKGNEIHREEYAQQMTSWDLLYYVLRANFDRVESGYCSLPPVQDGEGQATYQYGHTVTALHDLGPDAGVELSFRDRDGESDKTTADLVIAADGGSSTVRKLLQPDVERKYVGYVAWRGTVPERSLSAAATAALAEKFTFFHASGVQILAYLIPGPDGALEPGKRLMNWVWYVNYAAGSAAYRELMTDVDGKTHAVTLPVGKMAPRVWEKQKAVAAATLPPQVAEIVAKTEQPFIQAITDVLSPSNTYLDGRVLLVGDALAGFRPHTAASTSQAAYDALMLDALLRGEMSRQEWAARTMEYARRVQRRGVEMGERSQFGRHPYAGTYPG
ncbi:hypothetical protein B0A49_07653 [Cryomyces minteri]|uniref:2,6-dihydroxypyridine 3-monooxygenase substrate binding domain-containing protein n=1 Tax=Cryomyces minteri TaxID=331657 RepID=A0A4U0X346_9PEZI|nr:hypothetical protein B0A49_07653 [Cryomyces minteri]